MTRILVIDNYDSFVFTLVGYLQQLGAETTVIRNDEYDLDHVLKLAEDHDGVLISPGPGAPSEAGVIIDTIRWAAEAKKPLLGVCLGHQAIAEAFGGTVTHAPELMHGKTSKMVHENVSVFKDVPCPLHRDPLPLACGRTREHAGRPGNHLHDRQRHHHGPAPPRSPHARRAVPPRIGPDRRRLPDARQLA